mgnify:CR=1 FL=1
MNELCSTSATELAGLIRTRKVSSVEVVDAHLERIDEQNPTVNAVTATLADSARSAAAAVDRAVAVGEAVGPLAGVPFSIKENIDVAGTPTTQAVVALAEAVSPLDAPLVARVRAAGGIPIAAENRRFDADAPRFG